MNTLLLRSRLHGLLSGGLMLVTVTGRRSGRRYTTPVNYVRRDDVLTVFSRSERTWWRNLRGGAPVTVRLKGHDLETFGEVVAAPPEVVAAELAAARGLPPEKAARLAQDMVMVRIQLDAGRD